MNHRSINIFILAFLVFASKLMAGGSSGTTGQILELSSNEQIRFVMLDELEYQNALSAIKFNHSLQLEGTDSKNPEADTLLWPQGINIHGGLPFIRTIDKNSEDIFLLNKELSENKIEPTDTGFRFTNAWQDVALGGSSGTTGMLADALKAFYGIDTATVNPETFASIYGLIDDQSGNSALVNVENSYQFIPQRILKVDNVPVIEGLDDAGKYLYLFGEGVGE
ncbi:MAG: hypothetical protein KBD78_12830 [Oligoflexales bacterium]|nr:hypothetical protein [Oligoflexales bacterium]